MCHKHSISGSRYLGRRQTEIVGNPDQVHSLQVFVTRLHGQWFLRSIYTTTLKRPLSILIDQLFVFQLVLSWCYRTMESQIDKYSGVCFYLGNRRVVDR